MANELFRITNVTRGTEIANKASLANNFFTRLRGLLGRAGLPTGGGLIIRPCNSVHCFGMKFVIDVLFVDKDGKVVHAIASMKPGAVSPIVRGAWQTIELPDGMIAATGTQTGDKLDINVCK